MTNSQSFDAFILTSNLTFDSEQVIQFWAHSNQGPLLLEFEKQKGVFFVERNADVSGIRCERKEVSLQSFAGVEVDALYFNNQKDLLDAKETLESKGIRTYESDVRTPERFLMERFINGSCSIHPQSIQDFDGYKKLINPGLKPTQIRPNLKIMSLDIETGVDGSLYSIAYHLTDLTTDLEKRLVIMVGEIDDTEEYKFFKSEKELLLENLKIFKDWDPDCVIGWHVVGFDFDFLNRKYLEHRIDFLIGRGNSKFNLYERNGKSFADLPGRVIIDGPASLRGAFYSFENFKLETVASELLGTGKDIESDENKVGEIERRFREDKLGLAKYNLLDTTLVTDIFKKTKLVDLLVTRSQISGMLIDRIGLSTAAFDHFFLPKIHRLGFVASNVFDIQRDTHAAGGYVFEPEVGLHEDVIVLDFKSLYPTIIRTFHIDPYSLMMGNRENVDVNDIINTPMGINFSHTNHILPEFIEKLMALRATAKKEKDEPLSQAIKILMNSFYGVMGSSGCRFYHSDLPTAITGTGQWILKESKKYLEEMGYRVLYGDTDSVFVKVKDSDLKNVFERGNIIASEVNEYLKLLISKHYRVDSKLDIEFEKYYRKIFYSPVRGGTGGAKKKYAGVLQTETGETRLNFSGMEIVRGDWTKLAKNFQYGLFEKLFEGAEQSVITDWIKEFVDRLKNKEFDNDLVYKKRISKRLEDYTKSVPPHIKAAKMLDTSHLHYRLKEVSYIYTRSGPVPVQLNPTDVDYQHYIDKQIQPLADGVLFIFETSFNDIVEGDQMSLF